MWNEKYIPTPALFIAKASDPTDGFWLRVDWYENTTQAKSMINERLGDENWICADAEFLPTFLVPEGNCDLAQLVDIAKFWNQSEDDEEWTMFAIWAEDTAKEPTWANFRESYIGAYDSTKDFVQELREGDVSRDMMMYVDWDWVWDDLRSNYETYEKFDKIHIFNY